MRELTAAEIARLEHGQCPGCGRSSPAWRSGPAGGASRNIEMSCCGALINVVDPDRYGWPPPTLTGQMIREGTTPTPLH